MNAAIGRRACLAATTLSLLLSACEDAKSPQEREQHAVAVKRDDELPRWLSLTDRVDPAVWLAAKESGRPSPQGAAVERMRRALDEAKTHFLESPRMLANRLAQLGDMLTAAGMSEDYAELVGSLSQVASAAPVKQTFGEMCQHYFNLRSQGESRAAALASLAERYGAQTPRP